MKKAVIPLILLCCLLFLAYRGEPDISGGSVSGKVISYSTSTNPRTLVLSCEDDAHYSFLIDESTQLLWEDEASSHPETSALDYEFWNSPYISVTAGARVDYTHGHSWDNTIWYHAEKIVIIDGNNISSDANAKP